MKRESYLEFIHELLADENSFQAFVEHYKQRLPKSIKLISSKIKKSELLPFFQQQNWSLKEPDFSFGSLCYDDVCYLQKLDSRSLGSHFLHQAGFFYVQEVSAGLSAQLLPLEKGDKVLDLCAAPGGKTIQLADQLLKLGGGCVLANEVSNARRKALIFNINRCGLLNTAISAYNGTQIGDIAPECFDKVLVDAPCSGEGMQYKHDKTLHFWDQKLADQLAKLQIQLLISGLKALKVGGTLVYSTCTLNPFENEGVIGAVMREFGSTLILEEVPIQQKSKGFAHFRGQHFFAEEDTEKVARFRPHIQHTGGFFIAKIKKLSALPHQRTLDKRASKASQLDTSSQLQGKVRNLLDKNWGIKKQSGFVFLASQQAVYVANVDCFSLPQEIFIEKIGIPLFKIGYSGEWVPQQGLATVLGDYAQTNSVELTGDQAQELTERGTLKGDLGDKGLFLVLKWGKRGFALGKKGESELKVKW